MLPIKEAAASLNEELKIKHGNCNVQFCMVGIGENLKILLVKSLRKLPPHIKDFLNKIERDGWEGYDVEIKYIGQIKLA